ncbi:MAG: ABC transporter permease [Sandaracinaceae bacterium]|nr:ABC transporter permease [Sandaracinaceae bacterium]
MRNTVNIAARQLRSYFDGPAAYIVMFLVLLVVGGLFWWYFFLIGKAVSREMFVWMTRVMVVGAPAITMGLLSEEERSGTMELLMSMPLRESQVVLGKFLGAFGLYSVLVLLTLPHPIAVDSLGDLDWGPVFSGYVGLLLLGAAAIGIGLMMSSLTRNQLVAFFLSFFTLAVLWLVPLAFNMLMSGTWASLFQAISLEGQVENMARGVIDTRGVVYFLSLTLFSLAGAFAAVESRRWR